MALEQFAYLAEIFGVVAVIASLIYVGLQLKQNTTALHAQSRQSVLEASQNELFKVVDHPEITIAITNKSELAPKEGVALNNWYAAVMRARMFAWLQYRDRIIDQDQWEEERLIIQAVLSSRRGRAWWNRLGRRLFTVSFVELVDDSLRNQPVSDELYESMLSSEPEMEDSTN